ncbi:Purine-cytosine permease fcyB [Phytophthora nicotianae]|uniref:Purine-cytosine permease fcyB n=2 Tax=Phytophthora nicotianae TaxID=4792 RepID=A0A0W8D913_PHYNI|nr:Purine-cytosine permease fcyB [Phytophthora nicotianae]
MVANKQLSAFFCVHLGQGVFRCKICNKERKQVPGSGYSNLLAHLAGKHEGYEAVYASSQSNSSSSLQAFGFVSEESSHLFQWIQWVVMRNMPVSEVEDDLTRAMSKLWSVTTKAVKKCMEGIPIRVGRKLEKELGALFGLMFDGWSHAGVHYVGRYAVYEADGEVRVPLLGLSPLMDGVQTADAHIQMFNNILDVYKQDRGYGGVPEWAAYRDALVEIGDDPELLLFHSEEEGFVSTLERFLEALALEKQHEEEQNAVEAITDLVLPSTVDEEETLKVQSSTGASGEDSEMLELLLSVQFGPSLMAAMNQDSYFMQALQDPVLMTSMQQVRLVERLLKYISCATNARDDVVLSSWPTQKTSRYRRHFNSQQCESFFLS